MKEKLIETGKIVGTHGIAGMVRIQPWSDSPDFLMKFKHFFIDKNMEHMLKIKQIKPHGTVVIAKFEGVDTIADAEGLRGKTIYISRQDVKLPKGRYFVTDLIGCTATNADSGENLGIISDISKTGANDVWHIKDSEREYLVPAIDEVIVSVDIDDKRVVLRPMKGIFDDED